MKLASLESHDCMDTTCAHEEKLEFLKLVLGFEPRALHMLGKISTTSRPFLFYFERESHWLAGFVLAVLLPQPLAVLFLYFLIIW